jgi:hypothetical protein
MRIIHAWSNYYQDRHPVMIPTFERYLDPPPTIERQFLYDTLTQVPQLGVQYTPIKFYQMFNEIQSTTSRVDIKLTFTEIMAIHATARKGTKMKISTMDSLTAFLITVLNKTEDVPIRKIANVIDVTYT